MFWILSLWPSSHLYAVRTSGCREERGLSCPWHLRMCGPFECHRDRTVMIWKVTIYIGRLHLKTCHPIGHPGMNQGPEVWDIPISGAMWGRAEWGNTSRTPSQRQGLPSIPSPNSLHEIRTLLFCQLISPLVFSRSLPENISQKCNKATTTTNKPRWVPIQYEGNQWALANHLLANAEGH